MRRLDHSAIFVLIAGSYTPLFMLLMSPSDAARPLRIVWAFAFVGIAKALFWSRSPSWITAAMAVVAGWCAISDVLALASAMGTWSFRLLVASGVAYTIGGIVYATRRPDPVPKVFGYHEVFHALVIAGGLLHHAHLWVLLTNLPAG